MSLPSSQAANVAKYLRPAILRTPGPTVIDADHRRQPGPATDREILASVFPSGGRSGSRSSSSGEVTGKASHQGFALVEIRVADGAGQPTPGDLIVWRLETLEILEVTPWAGGDAQPIGGENAKTFFEFAARRVAREIP